jgi:hypothetical protein
MKYVLAVLAVIIPSLLLLSCGNRDDRDQIRAQYGEPDFVRQTTVDPYWSETWFYNSIRTAFEFRRTSGCGSNRDVYLNYRYSFAPNPIQADSTGVTLNPQDKNKKTQESYDRSLWPVAP